jgi:hypothetical protein
VDWWVRITYHEPDRLVRMSANSQKTAAFGVWATIGDCWGRRGRLCGPREQLAATIGGSSDKRNKTRHSADRRAEPKGIEYV